MKIWHMGLLRSAPIVCFALLLAFSGCEGTTDEDSSGVDAYLAAHPYESLTRDTPLDAVMAITPAQATLSIVGQAVVFTASGGDGAFHWGLTDTEDGAIESKGANQVIYTCLQIGNNDVIVQDDSGHYATAHISPVVNAMTVSPASAALAGGALYASFAVSGGTPPYTWTSGNTALGTITYSRSSSHVAYYTARAGVYGQNIITVVDDEGRTVSASISQAP